MEPHRHTKGAGDTRREQSLPAPKKDAYARLVGQHHSTKFRSYLEQFTQDQQMAAGETGTAGDNYVSLCMDRLGERAGTGDTPWANKHAVAARQRHGPRRDTNTSQDGDVESGEDIKHHHNQQQGTLGKKGPHAKDGYWVDTPQEAGKKRSKKRNAAKSKMEEKPADNVNAHNQGLGNGGTPKSQRGRNKTPLIDVSSNRQMTPVSTKGKIKNGRGKRNQMFEAYVSAEAVSAGLKRGELIQGSLRINPKKYSEAFVPSPDGMRDIFLDGMVARNRALNGDVVVVKILPREQWKVVRSDTEAEGTSEPETSAVAAAEPNVTAETRCSEGEEALAYGTEAPSLSAAGHGDQASNSATKCVNSADRHTVADKFLQRTAKVVYIIEQKHSRAATGFLKFLPDKNFAMFSPVDHRVPRVNVPLADCPEDFRSRPTDYTSILFICRITSWPDDSTFAEGRLVKSLGLAGEIEPETEGILTEYGVDFSEFSEEVLGCLPQNLPWSIPPEELQKRRDLRKWCIFTIDPATARDLDDALSCKILPDGNFEVGVHIADVSYFVEEGNSLDLMASQRATSVYMVQKVIPMLPRLLCEELCSLNPLTDRLTFSIIWMLSPQGKILSEWFGRSVIRSCVKLSYDHAQSMIDNPDRPPALEELPPCDPKHPIDEVHEAVLHLHRLAQHLRAQRFQGGALRLDQLKLSFSLDKETGMPQGCYIYQYRDSNKLVEEFMLLANMAVAHRIYRCFPEQALLRRHPPPQSKMVDDLVEFCNQMGLDLDFSSAGTLHRSLNETLGNDQYSTARKEVLTHMCSRPMQMAVYFCTGVLKDEPLFHHYALNVPFYTHFTSPIRRYADVLVHRLLAASLSGGSRLSLDSSEVQKRASNCNDRKTASKRVQELSSELFFAAFVKECGPLDSEGMVMGVLDQSIDVLVLKYGVQKRIYCNALQDLKSYHFHKVGKKPEMTLLWAADNPQREPVRQDISIFTVVEVQLKMDDGPLKYSAVLRRPSDS